MKMQLFAAAAVVGALAVMGTSSTVAAQPKGNAHGYWAGRLCDHTPPSSSVKYWESRYTSRGACVAAEGQSHARGEWDENNLPSHLGPI